MVYWWSAKLDAHFQRESTDESSQAHRAPSSTVILFVKANVGRSCLRVNHWKASGPISVPGLKTYVDHLAGVFEGILNCSLRRSEIHTSFKSQSVILVPKKSKGTCLNVYQPMPLTSKSVERLAMTMHINTCLSKNWDARCYQLPLPDQQGMQFRLALHFAPDLFDDKNMYIRLMLINYNRVFSTIIPSKLIIKWRTGYLLNPCKWILVHIILAITLPPR